MLIYENDSLVVSSYPMKLGMSIMSLRPSNPYTSNRITINKTVVVEALAGLEVLCGNRTSKIPTSY